MSTITSKRKWMSQFRHDAKSTWDKMVHAPFRKVVAFDLLFLALGMPIGAGLTAAFLSGDIQNVFSQVMSIAR